MRVLAAIIVVLAISGCHSDSISSTHSSPSVHGYSAESIPETGLSRALQSLRKQTEQTRRYDPSYAAIPYPGGDVPMDRGVCSDVVVRALRAAGVDLQKEIHEDMSLGFRDYPQLWGLRRPDSNIDHRRVPNLMTYFRRKGLARTVSRNPAEYRPGDIAAWELPSGRLHIGMIAEANPHPVVVHNIGSGPKLEDVLLTWKIVGHYRCFEAGSLKKFASDLGAERPAESISRAVLYD